MAVDGVALDVPACKMRSTAGWPAWPLRTPIGATREDRAHCLIWAARSREAPSPIFLRHSSDFFLTHSNRTQRGEAIPSDYEIRMARHSTVCRRPAGCARFPKCRWEGIPIKSFRHAPRRSSPWQWPSGKTGELPYRNSCTKQFVPASRLQGSLIQKRSMTADPRRSEN